MLVLEDDKSRLILNASYQGYLDGQEPETFAVEGADQSFIAQATASLQVGSEDYAGYLQRIGIKVEADRPPYFGKDAFVKEEADGFARLSEAAAHTIANKILSTQIIPCYIPAAAKKHFEHPLWRKAMWYMPLALVSYRSISPIVLEQNGIWALVAPNASFELVARFDDYIDYGLVPFSPETSANAMAELEKDGQLSSNVINAQDESWACLYFGSGEPAASKFSISFQERNDSQGYGNHAIVIKAILDVWYKTVNKYRDSAAMMLDGVKFREFESLAAVLDWAVSDAEQETYAIWTSLGDHQPAASCSLFDEPNFKRLVDRSKCVAIASGKTELSPELFLYAACLNDEIHTGDQNTLPSKTQMANRFGLTNTNVSDESNMPKLPVGAALQSILSSCSKASYPGFLHSLLEHAIANYPDLLQPATISQPLELSRSQISNLEQDESLDQRMKRLGADTMIEAILTPHGQATLKPANNSQGRSWIEDKPAQARPSKSSGDGSIKSGLRLLFAFIVAGISFPLVQTATDLTTAITVSVVIFAVISWATSR